MNKLRKAKSFQKSKEQKILKFFVTCFRRSEAIAYDWQIKCKLQYDLETGLCFVMITLLLCWHETKLYQGTLKYMLNKNSRPCLQCGVEVRSEVA